MMDFASLLVGLFSAFVTGGYVSQKKYGYAATMALLTINLFIQAAT